MKAGPRQSRLPVREAGAAFHLRRILVPVDFTENSKKALQYAIPFAKQFGAALTLLYVVEIPYGTAEVGAVDLARLSEEMRASGRTHLENLVSELQVQSLVDEKLVQAGTPYHEITQAAQDHDIDLIIISTHGRTGLARVFLGSTAERVVRHAPCPVLVVREKEHEFIDAAKTVRSAEPRPSGKRTRLTRKK